MSRHFAEALILYKHWQPYAKRYWMSFGLGGSAGYIISFKGHEEQEFKCSHRAGKEILNMAKEVN